MLNAAQILADLALEVLGDNTPNFGFIGTVTIASGTFVTIMPDGGFGAVAVGPMKLLGSSLPAVGDRVVYVVLEGGGYGCLGKIT